LCFCALGNVSQLECQTNSRYPSLLFPPHSCLLTETRICLCSQHHALLTPIAEAFLALLFPLVWQGAYIPIMPLGMVDILDAPVPFFVGLNR